MADAQRPTPDERGAWLREARAQAGYYVQANFARAVDLDKSLLSNYETGKTRPSDEAAEKIAVALKLPIIEVRRNLGLWVPPNSPAPQRASLADFTEGELIAELQRRAEARMTPGALARERDRRAG